MEKLGKSISTRKKVLSISGSLFTVAIVASGGGIALGVLPTIIGIGTVVMSISNVWLEVNRP